MSFAPLIWKGFSFQDPKHQQLFIGQICDLLNFLNSAKGLSVLLNGSSTLGADALTLVGTNLGTITTNQTVACAQAASVMIIATVSTVFSPTITMTNLIPGTPVSLRFTNSSGSSITWKLAATSPIGASYVISAYSNTAATNMVSTGLSIPAGQSAMFSGSSVPTELDMSVNVT